jgi:hypothetical protein
MELPVMARLEGLEELRHELTTKLPKELETARAHGDCARTPSTKPVRIVRGS